MTVRKSKNRPHSEPRKAKKSSSKPAGKRRRAEPESELTLEALAKFPEENPNPVMRVKKKGLVLYANRASAPLLRHWGYKKGGSLPREWKKTIDQALSDRQRITVDEPCGNSLYLIDIVPVPGADYAALYGRDVTEQQRAEKVLRESESHYRSLFDNMLNGFALCRMIFSRGKPRDFVYLAVNKSFENLTGLKNVVGKKVSEVIPGIRKTDPGLFEIFSRVSMTGKPEHMETWVESLKMWFSISVYCPRKEHFVAVFDVITERKRAETALQNSERRLREAQEMAHLGFWTWDVKTGAVEWSEEVFRIFDLDPKKFKPNINSILDLSPWPEDHGRDQELIRKAIESRSPGSYEQKFLRPDQSIGYYYSTFQGNYDKKGGLVSIVGTVLDITDRKKTEQELRESEDRFRSLYENANIGIYRTTPDGRILLANPALVAMLGYRTFEELAERDLSQASYEAGYPRREFQERIERDGIISGLESAWKRWDGSTVFVRESARLIRDEDGKPLYYDGVAEDISGRKRMEEALAVSEVRYRRLFESAKDGILILDAETGEIVDVNPFLVEMLGYSFDQFKGKAIWEIGFLKDIIANRDKFLELQRKEYVRYEDLPLRTADGESRNVEFVSNVYLVDHMNVIQCNIRDITDRKRAEDARRENEQRLSSIYNTVGDVIFHLAVEPEMQFRFASINSAFLRVTGLSQDMVVGRLVSEIIPEPSLAMVLSNYRRAMEEKTIVRWEETSDYPAGRVTGEVSIAPVFDEHGICTHLVGSVHDITDRKRAEDALRESEDKFKYFFEHSVIGKSITFPTGEIHVNEAFCKMLGYSPKELESNRWQDISHPVDVELTQKIIDSLLSGEKESARFIKRYLHKNGSIVWAEVASVLRRDAAGKPLYFMTTLIDITDRLQAEEKLRVLNTRQSAILDAVPDIIMEVDKNKVYTWANQPGVEFFGDDVVGREAQYYFEGEQETYQQVKPIFDGNDSILYVESWQKRRDGQKRLLTWWCRVLKDDNGKVTGALSTARDVTELRRAEEALRESEQHLRRFYESKLIGVIYWNMNGKITDANDKFLEMVGYTPDELAEGSIDWLNMTPPEYRLKDEQSVEELKATGVNKAPFEKEYIRKDGSRIPIIIAGAMLDEARFNGVAFVLDISDRKRAELDIRKQMEELQRWHDLTLDREIRAIELKREVNDLLVRLGEKIRYPSQESGTAEQRPNEGS